MANDYAINYDDKRFKAVESDKQNAISEVEKTYSGMINQSDSFYQQQMDASKDWEKKQSQLQQEQTDFTLDKIQQQKDQAQKDYLKEQSGAFVDWQKQSNEYGAKAEAEADQGMQNTGFSESSQVSMYNTYQQRVVAARETVNKIFMDFNNQMTEARLQNSSALAEIAYKAQQERLQLALEGFQYKNQLLLDQADKKLAVDQMYHERWQDVLAQINTENALAEQIRQHNESLAEDKRQFDAQMAEEKRQFDFKNKIGEFAVVASSGGGGGGGSSSSRSSGSTPKPKVAAKKQNVAPVSPNKVGTKAAEDMLNEAIASGASKDKVSNAISLALRNGKITQGQAAALRKTYTPRGLQY